jgi:hypothetical protein
MLKLTFVFVRRNSAIHRSSIATPFDCMAKLVRAGATETSRSCACSNHRMGAAVGSPACQTITGEASADMGLTTFSRTASMTSDAIRR